MVITKLKYRYNWNTESWEYIGKLVVRRGLPPQFFKMMDAIAKLNREDK